MSDGEIYQSLDNLGLNTLSIGERDDIEQQHQQPISRQSSLRERLLAQSQRIKQYFTGNDAESHPGYRSEFSVHNKKRKKMSICEEEARETWKRKPDFIVACVAVTVGLGNVWRIIRMCVLYHGGAFIFAYLFTAVLIAFPVVFIEVSLGQFTNSGGMKSWHICPLIKGVSITSAIVITVILCYQNVVLSWVCYYIFTSLTKTLPWEHCNNKYNTPSCTITFSFTTKEIDITDNTARNVSNCVYTLYETSNVTTYNTTDVTTYNTTDVTSYNTTDVTTYNMANVTMTNCTFDSVPNGKNFNQTEKKKNYVMPVVEFFERQALELSDSIYDLGILQWHLSLICLMIWFGVFACVLKGIHLTSKIMYITVTVPYIIMVAVFIRVCMVEGAQTGIGFFFSWKQEKLSNMNIWSDACKEVFISFSLGLGVLPVLGSYNEFFHDSFRDTVIFVIVNLLTVVFSCVMIFALIGGMISHETREALLYKQAYSGPAMMFIIYPQNLILLPVPMLWSFVFYIMIFIVAIDYQIFGAFTVVTAMVDHWPSKFANFKGRACLTAAYCISTYSITLILCTQGGLHVYTAFTKVATAKLLVFVCTVEACVISWIYGSERFIENFTIMTGRHFVKRARVSWQYITPIYLMIVLLYNILIDESVIESNTRKNKLPQAIYNVCTWISIMLIIPIPTYAGYCILDEWMEMRRRKKTSEWIIEWEDRADLWVILRKLVMPILPLRNQRRLKDRADYCDSTLISNATVTRERCPPIILNSRGAKVSENKQLVPRDNVCTRLRGVTFQESEQYLMIMGRRRCNLQLNVT